MRLVLCMFVCGCYTSTVYAPTARAPHADPWTAATVEMEVIRERESGRRWESTFRDMERTLRREVPRAHGFRNSMQGDLRIELRLEAIEVRTENARSRTAVLAMCAVVLLFPACAFIGATPTDIREVSTKWALEIFGVERSSIVREQHQTTTRAGIGRMTPGQRNAFDREIADDAARQLVRDTHRGVSQALDAIAR